MKENRTNRRAAGVHGRTKRYLVAVIAIILTLALSTAALADNGKGGSQGRDGGTETQQPNGGDAESGKTPPAGQANGSDNKRASGKEGLNIEKIEGAIAALTDENAKTDLAALLSTYVSAWSTKQDAVEAKETDSLDTLTEAVVAAKAALDTALEAAGISTDTLYGEPEKAEDGTGRMNNRPVLDTEEITAAITALDDTDENKAALTSVLTAYQEALAAQTAADTATLSEEELQVLADAVQSAEEALLEASRDAGIIGGLGRGQLVDGYAYGKEELDVTVISANIAALDDTDASKATLTALLQVYEAALTAQGNADTSALTEEEQVALNDATKAAADALKEAMENAGLDTQIQNRAQESKNFEMQLLSGENVESGENSGVIPSLINWLKSLFQ